MGKIKTLKEKGVTLDSHNFKQQTVECTEDEALEEFALYWKNAEDWGDLIPEKRKVRILEKALTAPVLPDKMIPLRPNNRNEIMYFEALKLVRDRTLLVQEIRYNRLMKDEEARKLAKEKEDEAKAAKPEVENSEKV